MIFELFTTFFIIGLVSFGGGYAIIPVIEHEVVHNGWMTTLEFTNIIGIAGMSPGPIATNSAILVGQSIAGLPGAVASALGMTLPSLLLIILAATLFAKFSKMLNHSLYGIKPIVVSMIIYSAIKFAITNGIITVNVTIHSLSLIALFGLSLFALVKLRWHPVIIIFLSGVAGSVLFS